MRPGIVVRPGAGLAQAANAAVIRKDRGRYPQRHACDSLHPAASTAPLDAVFGHVGDSRDISFQVGNLTRTRDHSLVQQMLDAGYGDDRLLRSHPRRHLLTSAIGAAGAWRSVSHPGRSVQPGDAFLLCSGRVVGFPGRFCDAGPAAAPQHAGRGHGRCNQACAPAGRDNYSAICVSTRDDSTVLIDLHRPEWGRQPMR